MNNIDILEEKEKEAIENLKGTYWYVGEEGLEENVKIALNLIETLIAENKELKEENEKLKNEEAELRISTSAHYRIMQLEKENARLQSLLGKE